MVDAGGEVNLGRLERVVCGEVDGEEENTAGVWGVALYWHRLVFVLLGMLLQSPVLHDASLLQSRKPSLTKPQAWAVTAKGCGDGGTS